MTVMERLTQSIIQKLEEGVVPWHKPWSGGGRPGRNIMTNRDYRGFNWLITTIAGYDSRYWMTFKQARQLGGFVKKGEKGTPIIYFRMIEKKDDPEKLIPFARYSTVFNLRQCEIPPEYLPAHAVAEITETTLTLSPDEKIQQCDEIYELWRDKAVLKHDEQRAFYRPKDDIINMPKFESFESPQTYYSTLYHEMTHATGHPTRLNRDGITKLSFFATESYGIEELIAEMGAARLCYEVGIDNTVEASAAYIDNWMKAIKQTPSILYKAAAAAEKAVNHILGESIEEEDADES